MATIPLAMPPGEVPADLAEAIATLESQGHTVVQVRDEEAERQHDPLAGMDLDKVPPAIWTALGITREEIERHRNAPLAVEHGHHQAAIPQS